MCGEEIQFFEIRTSYFEFLPSQHQSSRLQSCVSVKTRIQLYACCVSSNPRIQGWWWWGRRETVEYNGPLIANSTEQVTTFFKTTSIFPVLETRTFSSHSAFFAKLLRKPLVYFQVSRRYRWPRSQKYLLEITQRYGWRHYSIRIS